MKYLGCLRKQKKHCKQIDIPNSSTLQTSRVYSSFDSELNTEISYCEWQTNNANDVDDDDRKQKQATNSTSSDIQTETGWNTIQKEMSNEDEENIIYQMKQEILKIESNLLLDEEEIIQKTSLEEKKESLFEEDKLPSGNNEFENDCFGGANSQENAVDFPCGSKEDNTTSTCVAADLNPDPNPNLNDKSEEKLSEIVYVHQDDIDVVGIPSELNEQAGEGRDVDVEVEVEVDDPVWKTSGTEVAQTTSVLLNYDIRDKSGKSLIMKNTESLSKRTTYRAFKRFRYISEMKQYSQPVRLGNASLAVRVPTDSADYTKIQHPNLVVAGLVADRVLYG